jgi:hypothetical protein
MGAGGSKLPLQGNQTGNQTIDQGFNSAAYGLNKIARPPVNLAKAWGGGKKKPAAKKTVKKAAKKPAAKKAPKKK